jgi:hypothetical protein
MKHSTHIPTILAAFFFMITGLILEGYTLTVTFLAGYTPVRSEDQIFAAIFLLVGAVLFFLTKRDSTTLQPQDTPKLVIPFKMVIIITLVGIGVWFIIDSVYTKVFHYLSGLLPQNLVR